MSVNKFSNDFEIKELIHQYKKHECLWNIYSSNYKNKPLKQRAWSEIANFFHKTPNEVKRKVRYLRAAYVHEKRRVDTSKRSDSKTIHEPSLFYYREMDFLDSMVIWRKFDDSKDISNAYSESIGGSQDFEVKEFPVNGEDDYIVEPELTCKSETCYESDFNCLSSTYVSRSEPQSSTTIKNNSIKVKSSKMAPLTTVTHPQTKFLYYSFGKTIALQLQHLPLVDALLVMSEIQNMLTMKCIDHIRSTQNDNNSCSQSETEENFNEFINEN